MTHNAEEMLKGMAKAAELYPLLPGLVYRSFYDFVIQHGREYTIVPFTGMKAPRLKCFGNAMVRSAMFGMPYVEGFAMSPKGDVILHAWNADENGDVHDSTWCNTGIAYIGVEFSAERADDAIWNGDNCVLNDENRNYPIYQKPWTGEDYSLIWPYSDRLEALRRRDITLAKSVEEYALAKIASDSV